MIRHGLRDLLARGFLIEVAAAIAIALAALDFLQALVRALVTFATTDYPTGSSVDALAFSMVFDDELTFNVRGHPLQLAPVVAAALTLLAVLGVVLMLLRRVPRDE